MEIINKLLNKIVFWFNSARGYSSPTSIMSWCVPFIFGLSVKGNILNGLLALIGIVFVHLGVNLFDDVIDYSLEMRKVKRGESNLSSLNLQDGKCKYILDKNATLLQTLFVSLSLFLIALLIGSYLTVTCGYTVVWVVLLTGILCVLYPVLTYFCLGEFIVGFLFAPMLYFGTYFVMTKGFSLEVMLISISTGILTVGLLHTHTFMDYDFDVKNNKKTLCAILGSKNKAVIAQGVMMFLAYINIIICILLNLIPKSMILTLASIPTAVSLYRVLKIHAKNPTEPIERTFWMGPMENWDNIVKNNLQGFMLKFLLARNEMMIFTILVCVSKILSDVIK